MQRRSPECFAGSGQLILGFDREKFFPALRPDRYINVAGFIANEIRAKHDRLNFRFFPINSLRSCLAPTDVSINVAFQRVGFDSEYFSRHCAPTDI